MSIRGVILAAGRGSRMGSATDIKPKCLTEIAGRTLLDWQIAALKAAGLDDITIVRGYRPETFTHKGYKYRDNLNWANTNMVVSLFCADKPDDDTIISYSDIVYSPEHIKALINTEGDFVITADILWHELWFLRFENPLDDAETFRSANDYLVEIGSKTDNINDIEAQYMGLLKFSKHGWEIAQKMAAALPEERFNKLDMTSMLKMLLSDGHKIRVVKVSGKWCEVDNQHDLNSYRNMLDNQNWTHNWRW